MKKNSVREKSEL